MPLRHIYLLTYLFINYAVSVQVSTYRGARVTLYLLGNNKICASRYFIYGAYLIYTRITNCKAFEISFSPGNSHVKILLKKTSIANTLPGANRARNGYIIRSQNLKSPSSQRKK